MGTPDKFNDFDDSLKVREYWDGIILNKTTWQIIHLYVRNNTVYVKYLDGNEICRVSKLTAVKELEPELEKLKDDARYRSFCKSTNIYGASYFPLSAIFIPVNREKNKRMDTMVLDKLQSGEHVSRLHEIVKKCHFGILGPDYNEFDRLFQKIEKPYVEGIDGDFSYAKVIVNCASTITIEDVRTHKTKLDQRVIRTLEKTGEFKKYNLPVTALQVSNLILTRDKRLEYTFDIKKEIRGL